MDDYRDFKRFTSGSGIAWLNTQVADGWELLAHHYHTGGFQGNAGWQFLVGHRNLPAPPKIPLPDELTAEPESLLVGVRDAAVILGVSRPYMYELVRTKQISSVTRSPGGRGPKLIPRKDLAEWILKRTDAQT